MGKKKMDADTLADLIERFEAVETEFHAATFKTPRLKKAQEFTLPHMNRVGDCMNGMLEVMRGER